MPLRPAALRRRDAAGAGQEVSEIRLSFAAHAGERLWELHRPIPRSRYPDLPGLIARLHDRGLRVLGYLNPFLHPGTSAFEEAPPPRLPRAARWTDPGTCSTPAGRLQHLGDGRFRMIFRPSLDPSNRLQFRGCLEDWKVDHVRLDVESMRDR